jgi:3-deoxy-D-manno-octulosonate 8-phosphate phosphatase (KDO 8-P phosphatase)
MEPADTLAQRCQAIDLLVMDVDGVLTDGLIILDDHGVETKHFYVRDGSGIHLWRRAGKRAAILSGRAAPVVEKRAAELGIDPVVQGMPEKWVPFQAILGQLGVEPRHTCYMGDDLPDLPVLKAVGLAACPADAIAEVRAQAHLITQAPGGRGAVRELVEAILKHQGVWGSLLAGLERGQEAGRTDS